MRLYIFEWSIAIFMFGSDAQTSKTKVMMLVDKMMVFVNEIRAPEYA